MKTKEFCRYSGQSEEFQEWALSISDDMADVWDAMVEQKMHERLIWTATRPGVFPDSILRKLACRLVRETPIADGGTVWDLLADGRSRKAVEVAERYADGKAMKKELVYACQAASAAAYAASDAAYQAAARVAADDADDADAADWAACVAAYQAAGCAADCAADAAASAAASAAAYAADAAACTAQVRMFAELGNPFKEKP